MHASARVLVEKASSMPRLSKRQLAGRKNAKKRRKHKNGPSIKFSGVSHDSPLLGRNDSKRNSIPKKFFDDKYAPTFMKQPIVYASPTKLKDQISDNLLENKYQAVFAYERESFEKKKVSNTRAQEICDKYGLGSVRTLRRIASLVRARHSLRRKIYRGQRATVTNRLDIISFIEKKAREWDYSFPLRAMAGAVYKKFGIGSSTIKKILVLQGWKTTKAYIKPHLTDDHKAARSDWCLDREKNDFFKIDVVPVHIDEKHFFAHS